MVGPLPDRLAVVQQVLPAEEGKQPAWQAVQDSFHVTVSKPLLNLELFIAQCAPSKEVVIYGLKSCRYLDVKDWLEKQSKTNSFKKVFSHLDGLGKISVKNDKIKSLFKVSLVDFILKNVRNQRYNIQIVPIVFIIGFDHLKLDVHSIVDKRLTSKNSWISYVTNAEIRTAYRLCYDPFLEEEICQVALRSFLFIALKTNPASAPEHYAFSILPKPWECSEYQEGWKKRIKPLPATWQIQLKNVLRIPDADSIPPIP